MVKDGCKQRLHGLVFWKLLTAVMIAKDYDDMTNLTLFFDFVTFLIVTF